MIKESMYKDELKIMYAYAPNTKISKYVKQKLIRLRRETDNCA